MKINEKQLCNLIIEVLNLNGCFVWRTNAGKAQFETNGKKRMVTIGKAGTSDIIGLYKGRFLALEVKLPTTRNKVTILQQDFLDEVKRHGGIAAVVTSPEEALETIHMI